MKYEHLFAPLKIGGMMLRNRIIAAPIGIIDSHKIISSINYGNACAFDRSLGGAAMVQIEGQNIFSKYELDVTKERINVAKQDGTKVSYELEIFDMVPDNNGYVLGPMDGIRFDGFKMRAFTKEDINKYYETKCEEAINAKKVGIDCLLIHLGHDSLGSQFLSPIWNQREDEYGGSLENRCRFIKELLSEIRKAVGKDYLLIARISRNLMVKETYSEDDCLYLIKEIEDLVDMVNISCGMDVYYDANVYAVPTIFEPHSFNANFAKRVKEETKVKVCLVGAVMSAKESDELIKNGYTDCVMCGRSLIADPYWPKKILDDKEEDVTPCIRCMHCYHIATKHWNTQCSVNPRFRRELREAMSPSYISDKKKKILVIGGGPSGIIAAIEASKKGHDVTLIEKSNRLGGLLVPASQGELKIDLHNYLDYLLRQIEKSDVKVLLNTEADVDELKKDNYDRVIIAIGSKAKELDIEGKEYLIESTEAINHPELIDDDEVVFIGGGFVAIEMAIERARVNKKSIILEATNEVASSANELYKIAMNHHLKENENLIDIRLNVKVKKLDKDYIYFDDNKLPYKKTIYSIGRVSKSDEAIKYYGIAKDTVMIGDCEKVGSLVDHTNIAYFVGKNS